MCETQIDNQSNAEGRLKVNHISELEDQDDAARARDCLAQLFPEVIEDGKLDVAQLRAIIGEVELSDESDTYGLRWPGRDRCVRLLHGATDMCLEPDHAKSVNFEKTDNILIEGEALLTLKLLQKSYLSSIKMIYIDPPYNTGKEFVYEDNYTEPREQYLKMIGQIDNSGMVTSEIDMYGRKHTKWLNMMYPRLKLARNLLTDDGVIYISIDEHEHANLLMLCNLVFGEENHFGEFIRKTKSTTNDAKSGFNNQHEYCLAYAKNKQLLLLTGELKNTKKYTNPDNDPNGPWMCDNPSAATGSEDYKFPITNPITKEKIHPPNNRFWAFSKKTCAEYIKSGKIVFLDKSKKRKRDFILKKYLKELKSLTKQVDSLIFADKNYMNQVATKDMIKLLGVSLFKYSKPVNFIEKLIEYTTKKGDIILDFFAGSGTTGHATINVNNKNWGGGENSSWCKCR